MLAVVDNLGVFTYGPRCGAPAEECSAFQNLYFVTRASECGGGGKAREAPAKDHYCWQISVSRTFLCTLEEMTLLTALLLLVTESSAGLHWTAPAPWKIEGQRPMRAATYTVAPEAGDKDPAECAVYFFGVGQGGSVQANLDRWKGQFKPSDAKISKATVHTLPVTRIDVSGEYSGMGGPMAQAAAKPAYRLLGAIVEGPGGNIFIKFTGPAKTVAANQQKFEALLASFGKD
jgi:hypothetical protein